MRPLPRPADPGDLERYRLAVIAEVRALMARHRAPQREVAAVLGCSQQAASRRLVGLTAFTTDDLCALAAHFDVDPATLLPPSGPRHSIVLTSWSPPAGTGLPA